MMFHEGIEQYHNKFIRIIEVLYTMFLSAIGSKHLRLLLLIYGSPLVAFQSKTLLWSLQHGLTSLPAIKVCCNSAKPVVILPLSYRRDAGGPYHQGKKIQMTPTQINPLEGNLASNITRKITVNFAGQRRTTIAGISRSVQSTTLQVLIGDATNWKEEICTEVFETGKTLYVYLALAYEYRAKHLTKAHKKQCKTCSMALNAFRIFCRLSCGPGTCMKLISPSSSWVFCSKYIFRGKMHMRGFSCLAKLYNFNNSIMISTSINLINIAKYHGDV